MSSSTAATLSPDTQRDAAQPSKAAVNEVLRITHHKPSFSDPFKSGTWLHLPEFFSIRYRAAEKAPRITEYDEQKDVAKAIWQRVAHLLPAEDALAGPTIGVVFDVEPWNGTPFIDVVCSTADLCKAIREELRVITVEDRYKDLSIYALHCWSDGPFLDVMPLDIFAAKVEGHEVVDFVEKLTRHVSKVGSLVGPIRTIITSDLDSKVPLQLKPAIRAYVKLLPSITKLSSFDLWVSRTKLSDIDWKGGTPMMTSVRHLPCWPMSGTASPSEASTGEGGTAAAEGLALGGGASGNQHDNSDQNASKKRKSSHD